MPTTKPDRPSEEEMWAGPSGQKWLVNATLFEASLRPIGDELLARAALAPGEHVIDVGCGAGSMSLEIARRVAPNGSVTGLDISPDLVAEATRRAAAAAPGASVRFVAGDAARAALPAGQADCLISRFGALFFTDPYAAFSHLHSLLRPAGAAAPAGRIALACWAPLKQNPWMFEVRSVLAAHFDLPMPPPRIPGPFAFEEPAYLQDVLAKAGFKHIDINQCQSEMYVGGPGTNPETATAFLLSALSLAQRATEAPAAVLEQVRRELQARLQPFQTPHGIRMPASVFFATARA